MYTIRQCEELGMGENIDFPGEDGYILSRKDIKNENATAG